MSTVIKAGGTTGSVHHIAFNLEDMAQQANRYLDQIRLQAAQIVVEAQKQAEAVRRKAEEEGKQAAMRAVESVLDQKVGKKMETLLPAIQQVVRDLTDAKQTWLKHWEQSTVRLAVAIAQKVTRREHIAHPDITISLVREALEMTAGSPQIRILMNPTDVETLGSQVTRVTNEFRRVGTAEVIADAAISPGGCRVEADHGSIDQQFESQLARIETELTSTNED